MPPLFIFAGFVFSFLYQRLKSRLVFAILVVVFILPGFSAIIRLHPYEYIYYNMIMGDVGNVYGEYELDYWCTSLREAIEYVNETAPQNATVYISGPITAAIPFAREDLDLINHSSYRPDPEYVVGCRYVLLRDDFFPEHEIIHEVGIGEGVFAIVKEWGSD